MTEVPLCQRGPARRTERCSSEAVCQLCAQAGVAHVRTHLGARCRFHARGQGRGRQDPVTPHWRPPAAGGPGAGHTPPGKAAGPRKVSSSLFLVSVSLQEGWVKCRRRLRSPSSPGRDAETASAITRSRVAAEWRLRGLCRGWAASLGRPGQCFLWAPLAGFASVATVRWQVGGGCIRSGRGSLHTVFLPQRGWTGYFIPWRHYSKRARPEAQVFCPASAHFKCDSVPLAKAGRTASTRREAGLVGAVKMTVSRSHHAT